MAEGVKFQVRDLILCLLVAIPIGAVIVTLAITNPPWLHRVQAQWQDFLLLTTVLSVGAVSQYRRAWKSKGFWVLLLMWLALHTAAWALILHVLGDRLPKVAYILSAGFEAMALFAAIYWVLGIPPPLIQK
jgi:hypothetical protein